MPLLVWSIKQCLKHSIAFLTQTPEVHITPSKNMVRPITAIAQALVPTFVLLGSLLLRRDTMTMETLINEII